MSVSYHQQVLLETTSLLKFGEKYTNISDSEFLLLRVESQKEQWERNEKDGICKHTKLHCILFS